MSEKKERGGDRKKDRSIDYAEEIKRRLPLSEDSDRPNTIKQTNQPPPRPKPKGG